MSLFLLIKYEHKCNAQQEQKKKYTHPEDQSKSWTKKLFANQLRRRIATLFIGNNRL